MKFLLFVINFKFLDILKYIKAVPYYVFLKLVPIELIWVEFIQID